MIKLGEVVTLENPVSFSGIEYSKFKRTCYYRKGKSRPCFATPEGMLVRLDETQLIGFTTN